MTNETITIYRGDSPTIEITVYDYTGSVAFDLTSYTIQLMVKKKETDIDSDAALTKDGSLLVAGNGTAEFVLAESDTDISEGDYVYDIQIKNGSLVYTVSKGTFTVTRDIRRAGN